jgi:hypothetical protein
MTDARALRYRRLALAEQDTDAAKLLRLLAEEAEQGILCVSEWRSGKGLTHVPNGSETKP